MHTGQAQVTRIDLAEGDKEHQENQYGLDNTYKFIDKWSGWYQKGYVYIDKVANGTRNHRNGERPKFDKLY